MDNNHPNNQNNNNYINLNEEENNEIYQILLNKLNKNKNLSNNKDIQPDNTEKKEENQKEEEAYEEDEEEPKNKKIEEKNFSQQVDFLFHPNDPEDQSSIKNILIKQYKKQKHIIQKDENINSSKNKNTKNITKSKSKNNNINVNKKEIPYLNKNKGLFDPYLTQKELDYESKIKKEREEKQKKIAEYEKRKKIAEFEKNKNKKKLEEDLNKRILNYTKPKIKPTIKAQNYDKKKIKKNEEDLIKHFVKVPKPKIQKKLANILGFNPQKYDAIINSLLNEINEVKNERKKENEMFKKKIQIYSKDNVDKYNNYYEFIYKKQKLNYENNKLKNPKYNNINNNKMPTRGQIINGLMKKYFGKDIKNNKVNVNESETLKDINLDNENNKNINDKEDKQKKINKNNNITNIDDILLNNEENMNKINFDNIDKLLSAENITFQDKINILIELNKNLDNYYKDMPIFIEQVKSSLDKLYENEPDPYNFRKEVNKVPFVAMASKAAFQIIQTNNDQIIEQIIDELLYECIYDLNIIDKKKKIILQKEKLIDELNKVQNNINVNNPKNEEEILEKLNIFLKKNEEELQNKINNDIINYNKKKKLKIIKFRAFVDDKFIEKRNNERNNFKEYMIYKGSFYHENIFDIYDEFIEEEGENILNKIIDNYVDELHRQAQNMANEEMNNIEGK